MNMVSPNCLHNTLYKAKHVQLRSVTELCKWSQGPCHRIYEFRMAALSDTYDMA